MNLVGKLLGNRYEIIEKIGNGGMATVYKARCLVLKRYVAVKVLKEEFNALFDNSFNNQGYDTTSIEKPEQYKEQDIIYAAYKFQAEKDEVYDVDINIPVFNVNSQIADEFNQITQSIFANKADEDLEEIADYYDYLEIQPLGNNEFYERIGKKIKKPGKRPKDEEPEYIKLTHEQLIEINKDIIELVRITTLFSEKMN